MTAREKVQMLEPQMAPAVCDDRIAQADESQQRLATALRGNAPLISRETILARPSDDPAIVAARP